MLEEWTLRGLAEWQAAAACLRLQLDQASIRSHPCRRLITGGHFQPSCGRATGSSDLAVLLCSQPNERQADAELVEDLLDGERSFDKDGRVEGQHPRRARRRR